MKGVLLYADLPTNRAESIPAKQGQLVLPKEKEESCLPNCSAQNYFNWTGSRHELKKDCKIVLRYCLRY